MATKAENDGMDSEEVIKICKDCKIPFHDIYAYAEHLESKEHFRGTMKQKYGKKYLEAKAKLDEKNLIKAFETSDEILLPNDKNLQSDEEGPKVVETDKSSGSSSAKGVSISDDDNDEDEVYTCEICEKICTGILAYQLHLQGKKHQKSVKKIALLKEMKEQKLLPETNTVPEEESLFDRLFTKPTNSSSNLECKVCKKKCTGPESYKMHCKGASHQKKVAKEELLKGMEAEGLSPAKDHDSDGETFSHCDICNKEFSGPVPYVQHMKSISHAKQELRQKQLGKIQNLIISKEEDSKFKCKECGKSFSGPIPFNNHLKSSAHDKKIKKNQLIDNLTKKHPELVRTTPLAENSIGNDEGDQYGCEICSVVFSGPEAALDHIESPKHEKAKQKKAMFKKFKQQQKAGKLSAISGGEKKGTKSDSKNNSDFEEEFDIINES